MLLIVLRELLTARELVALRGRLPGILYSGMRISFLLVLGETSSLRVYFMIRVKKGWFNFMYYRVMYRLSYGCDDIRWIDHSYYEKKVLKTVRYCCSKSRCKH